MNSNATEPEKLLEFLLSSSTTVLRYISYNLKFFQEIAKESQATKDSIVPLCSRLNIQGEFDDMDKSFYKVSDEQFF